MKTSLRRAALALALVLSACNSSADVTPPPGMQATAALRATQSAALPTPAPAPAGEVRGRVVHGAGRPLPQGLQVTLHAFDGEEPAFERTQPLDPSGEFHFDGVEAVSGRVFIVSTQTGGLLFSSPVLEPDALGAVPQAVLTLYDTSSDASSLFAGRLHIVLDFPDPATLRVVQMWLLSNPGDAVIVPQVSGGWVLHFGLPAGYSSLQFSDGALGDPYIKSAEGFGDPRPVYPGSETQQVLYSFELPYQPGQALTLPIPLRTLGGVVMLADSGVTLHSTQLQPGGVEDIQGMQIQTWDLGEQAASSLLSFTLQGQPASQPAPSSGGANPATLWIGAAGLALVLILAGGWGLLRRRSPAQTPEQILDAILELDERFIAGAISGAQYRSRRSALFEHYRDSVQE